MGCSLDSINVVLGGRVPMHLLEAVVLAIHKQHPHFFLVNHLFTSNISSSSVQPTLIY